MSSVANMPPSLEFSVDSQLLGELGEKLVTNNYIALSELIKNAYDADSSEITIELNSVKRDTASGPTSEIIVSDNGSGMGFVEVQSLWMRIATANKANEVYSPLFGRTKTGNKGIGRFACQRLAEQLILETTAKVKGSYETTTVTFNWDDFKVGTEVTSIHCQYTLNRSKSGRPGTTLRLLGVRDAWTQRDFRMFKKNVALLSIAGATKRNGYREDPGFKISIDAAEFQKEQIDLKDEYLASGWGSLSGHINVRGEIELELAALGLRRSKKYKLDGAFKQISGVSFAIHFLPFPKEIENRRKPTQLTRDLHKRILDDYSGIRLYLDQFRVYPYGEAGDDWLSIDRDVSRRRAAVENVDIIALAEELGLNPKRALLNHPRNGNLVGEIHISKLKNSPFLIKMDREGLVENNAFRALHSAIRQSLEWLTIQYEAFRLSAKTKMREQAEEEFSEVAQKEKIESGATKVESALSFLTKVATQEINERPSNEPRAQQAKAAKSTATAVATAAELVKQKLEESEAELAILRSVASTSPLMFVFAHEIKGITSYLTSNAAFLRSLAGRLNDKKASNELIKVTDHLKDTKARFDQLNKFFNIFSNAQQIEIKRIAVLKAFQNITNGFGFILASYGISVDLSEIDQIAQSPRMSEAEFYSIAVNLLSNAVKASVAGGGKIINIECGSSAGSFYLRVCDQGVGLSQRYWEDVFKPLVVDPEEKIYTRLKVKLRDEELYSLGKGSGLGLSIVKSVVEKFRGDIKFIKPKAQWKACVEVIIPITTKN